MTTVAAEPAASTAEADRKRAFQPFWRHSGDQCLDRHPHFYNREPVR